MSESLFTVTIDAYWPKEWAGGQIYCAESAAKGQSVSLLLSLEHKVFHMEDGMRSRGRYMSRQLDVRPDKQQIRVERSREDLSIACSTPIVFLLYISFGRFLLSFGCL